MASVSQLKGTLPDRIREGLDKDPLAKSLMVAAQEGKIRRFWVKDGLLFTKGDRLFVPKWDNLRRELLRECHETLRLNVVTEGSSRPTTHTSIVGDEVLLA